MWIPYFLLEFWEPESSPETLIASDSDTSEREFEIWFFLENPPTRQREVEIRLKDPETRLQTDGMGRQVSIRFEPNQKWNLEKIGFRVTDSNPKAAFRYCYYPLSQLLSVWALTTGSGFSIYGLRIFDKSHGATWKVVPQRATPEEFGLPLGISMGEEHAAMLSLYREGRNAQSPFYRFLCCYKILEAWYRHGSVFGLANRIVREKNLPFGRPRRNITQDMLALSMVFGSHSEFDGVSFGRFFEMLHSWRVKVAHALTDAGDFVNFDKYESQIELGPIANLTDLVARQVLLDDFELWHKITEVGVLEETPESERG